MKKTATKPSITTYSGFFNPYVLTKTSKYASISSYRFESGNLIIKAF